MKTGISAAEAMTERPILMNSADSITKCAEQMEQNHVGAIIVTEKDNPVGIITEQDIVRKIIAKGLNHSKMSISDVMEKDITTISPEKDIFEALLIMRDMNIRHLPVTDGSKMLGLLTLKDILKIEPQLFDLLVEKFELREEARKPINNQTENEGICQACGQYSDNLFEKDALLLCRSCLKEN